MSTGQKIIVVVANHAQDAASNQVEFFEESASRSGLLVLTSRLRLDLETPLVLKRGDRLELSGVWETDYRTGHEIPIFFADTLRKL
jgi:hypothetical protein